MGEIISLESLMIFVEFQMPFQYFGNIPEYSLALVAYTMSTYSASSGPHKDQLAANLHIHFRVMLYESILESNDGASGD